MSRKTRVDQALVQRGMANDLKQATALIYANKVHSSTTKFKNPSELIGIDEELKVIGNLEFVSRAGNKLQDMINEYPNMVKDKVVVDLGTSTGGFADCLLKNGAKKIYAVDVGTNQLDYRIRKNDKVISMENKDYRDLLLTDFAEKIDIVTCDISFISSLNVFDKLNSLFKYPIIFILLIKPQFEVNYEIASKEDGFIDKSYHQDVIDKFKQRALDNNFKEVIIKECSITGKIKNNTEYISK
jgi:23S rRNA (cytidine1920-2'-O)/16S rRNA (cytidine1409-2'-O)-methyltransferase